MSKFKEIMKQSYYSFPWVKHVLQKLKGKAISREETKQVVLFVSCIALLQQGWFVNYQELAQLESELPLSQFALKRMEIQSKFLLRNMKPKLWRIHKSIPV